MDNSEKMRMIDIALSKMGIDKVSDKGEIKQRHLFHLLSYLIDQKQEEYDITLVKMAASLQTTKRHIREDMLDGIEAWGIIKIMVIGRTRFWMINIDDNDDNTPNPEYDPRYENNIKPNKKYKPEYDPRYENNIKPNKKPEKNKPSKDELEEINNNWEKEKKAFLEREEEKIKQKEGVKE